MRVARTTLTRTFILTIALTGLVSLAGSPTAQAGAIADKQAARLARVGPLIANSAEDVAGGVFSVHSSSAVPNNDTFSCRSEDYSVANSTDMHALNEQLRQAQRDYNHAMEDFSKRKGIAQAPIYNDKTLTRRARDKKLRAVAESFEEEWSEMHAYHSERMDSIRRQQRQVDTLQDGIIEVALLHEPANPEQLMLPLTGGAPTASFVTELNDALRSLLGSCDRLLYVDVSHYYRNAYRYGDSDDPVIVFRYQFRNGRLTPNVCDKPNCRGGRAVHPSTPPQQTVELTLAGFARSEMAKADAAGEYRLAFAYAAGRRDGIVYKLDPFWTTYPNFDIARRIFDGEFGNYRGTPEFKAFYTGLATGYSKHCAARVTRWETFERPYDAYEGSSYALDGSRTSTYSERTKTYRVDARFGSHWAQFDRDLAAAALGQGLFEGFALVLGLRGEMEQFLKAHACDSAVVSQLTENFLRAADGRPSAQDAALQFANALAESDAPTKQGPAPSRYAAILERAEFAAPAVNPPAIIAAPAPPSKTVQQPVEKPSVNGRLEAATTVAVPAPGPETTVQKMPQDPATARQAAAERTQRMREIDQETQRQIQDLVQAQHERQKQAADDFRQKLMTTSAKERTEMLEAFRQQQTEHAEEIRLTIQKLRAEANERKKLL